MKAIIAAAGEGKRMHPLTLATPKSLIEVNGLPTIDYIFSSLPDEITEVVVIVKYLGGQIKDYLGKKHFGKRVYITEGSDRGNAYSVLSAKPFINYQERFLFMFGDLFPLPQDVSNCLKKELSVLVFESKTPQKHGIVSLKSDGSIGEIVEKPEHPASRLAVGGVMVLNDKIFYYPAFPSSTGEYFFTSLLNQFVKEHKVVPVVTVGPFLEDLSSLEDIARLEKILSSTKTSIKIKHNET